MGEEMRTETDRGEGCVSRDQGRGGMVRRKTWRSVTIRGWSRECAAALIGQTNTSSLLAHPVRDGSHGSPTRDNVCPCH